MPRDPDDTYSQIDDEPDDKCPCDICPHRAMRTMSINNEECPGCEALEAWEIEMESDDEH